MPNNLGSYKTQFNTVEQLKGLSDACLASYPKKIYATTGSECNLYFKNCHNGSKLAAMIDSVVSFPQGTRVGRQYEECWRYTPEDGDVLNAESYPVFTLPLRITDYLGESVVGTYDVDLIISQSTAGPPERDPVNLCTNGLFTTDTTGWTNISRITSDSTHNPCGSVTGAWTASGYSITLSPSTQYTLEIYAKCVAGASGIYPLIGVRYYSSGWYFVKADGSGFNTIGTYDGLTVGSSWAKHTLTFTTPANGVNGFAGSAQIFINNSGSSNCETHVYGVSLSDGQPTKGSINCVCFGDSTFEPNSSGPLGELFNLFASDDAMGITFAGPRSGTSVDSDGNTRTIAHGSVSGAKWNDYYSSATIGNNVANPFWTGTAFDFRHWSGYTALTNADHVIFNLGLNDVSAMCWSSFEAYIGTVKTALEGVVGIGSNPAATTVRGAVPGINVDILLPTFPSSQDGFGDDYPASVLHYHVFTANMTQYRNWLLENYGDLESDNIRLLPYHISLDPIHNMESASVAANARTSATVTRATNALHLIAAGYYQQADNLRACLKGIVGLDNN